MLDIVEKLAIVVTCILMLTSIFGFFTGISVSEGRPRA